MKKEKGVHILDAISNYRMTWLIQDLTDQA